jgi:hypothetical protein
MPGEKMLLLKEAVPVMLPVMSVILTIQGELQGTVGFHDAAGSMGKGEVALWVVSTVLAPGLVGTG